MLAIGTNMDDKLLPFIPVAVLFLFIILPILLMIWSRIMIKAFFRKLGMARKKDKTGNYFRVPETWTGIATHPYPHYFYLYGNTIRYPLIVRSDTFEVDFGGVAKQRIAIGSDFPIEYHHYLSRMGWMECVDEEDARVNVLKDAGVKRYEWSE